MHRQIAGRLTSPVTKWIVLVLWILAIGGLGGFAGKLTGQLDNQTSSWLPGTAESTKAIDQLKPFQSENAIPTTVVYEKKSGFDQADLQAMKDQTGELAKLEGVTGKVVGPIPSKDGQAAQTLVTFDLGNDGWNKMPALADKIRDIATIDGVTSHVAGSGGQAADSAEAFEGLDGKLLWITVSVVIVILLLTYRSPLLWLLPIISAGVALVVAQAVVYFLAKGDVITVNGQSEGILTVLVFGAGTDYALLLIARYREELRRHEDRHEAMAFALHRAAPAIVASAATVVLGMLCLTLAEMNSTAGLGPVAAIGIAVGLLVMITLLPALLVITGRWIFWPVRPDFGSPEPTATGFWARIGGRISVRPRTVWIGTSIILAIASVGVFKLNAHGLSTEDQYTKEFDSIVGQKILTKHELADASNPALIVTAADQADDVVSALGPVSGIEKPSTPFVKGGTALIQVAIKADASSESAFDVVKDMRNAVHAVPGAHALVGGTSAIFLDVETASARDNRVIIPAVLLVVLLILMLLLRAVVAPLVLIGTVVLSFGAALGLSALLFRYVFGFAGADASLPLFVFVFLVALGIDYNIFLMTRVREETADHGTRKGALIGLAATGGVITSAGLVLASTFLVLGTMPLVAFVEIGVGVALGVILDTMIVRSVLVTALNLDLGSKMWWPSKLDRGGPHDASELDRPQHRADVPVDAVDANV